MARNHSGLIAIGEYRNITTTEAPGVFVITLGNDAYCQITNIGEHGVNIRYKKATHSAQVVLLPVGCSIVVQAHLVSAFASPDGERTSPCNLSYEVTRLSLG